MYHRDFMYEVVRERMAEQQRVAEQYRMARQPGVRGPSWWSQRCSQWRVRAARRFFDMAFTVERDEAWRAVWDRMNGERPASSRSDRARN